MSDDLKFYQYKIDNDLNRKGVFTTRINYKYKNNPLIDKNLYMNESDNFLDF